MCPRFDPGSGHHFFALISRQKKWSLKRLRFIARQSRFIRHSRASCAAGALHKTPFQMKQLHFIPLWSICFSQIWSTSLWRCLYNKEFFRWSYASQSDWLFSFPENPPQNLFFVLNSPFGESGERNNSIKQPKFSVLPFPGTPRLRSNMLEKCVSGQRKINPWPFLHKSKHPALRVPGIIIHVFQFWICNKSSSFIAQSKLQPFICESKPNTPELDQILLKLC